MHFTDWSVQSVNIHIAIKAMFHLLNNVTIHQHIILLKTLDNSNIF